MPGYGPVGPAKALKIREEAEKKHVSTGGKKLSKKEAYNRSVKELEYRRKLIKPGEK